MGQMFLLVSGRQVGAHPDGPAPAWRLHINLYKFGKDFLRISSIRKTAVF